MHRLVVMYPQPEDPAHFRAYYEVDHLALGRKVPGVIDMHHSFEVGGVPTAPGVPGPGDLGIFCVFTAAWETEADMVAALSSPEGQAVLADVPNYATGGVYAFHYEVD